MFQFRRFPSYAYFVQRRMTGYCPAGLPHSEIPGSMDICSSPRLIAACHVLRRLLMPRHSPCALSSLTCSSQSPLSSLAPRFSPKTRFRRTRTGVTVLLRVVREFLVLFENYAGLQRSKLYVTLHPFGCCSTINLLRCMSPYNASLLPYFTLLLHCSVFKVHYPITFAIRFEDPTFQSGLQIQQQTLFGGPEWARTTDLAIISRTL